MLQILKDFKIGKWYDFDRHSLGELEEKRNYSRMNSISIKINTLVPRYSTFFR